MNVVFETTVLLSWDKSKGCINLHIKYPRREPEKVGHWTPLEGMVSIVILKTPVAFEVASLCQQMWSER